MIAAPALDTDRLRRIPGRSTKPALRQAATFLADLLKPGVLGPPGEFDSDKVGGASGPKLAAEEAFDPEITPTSTPKSAGSSRHATCPCSVWRVGAPVVR